MICPLISSTLRAMEFDVPFAIRARKIAALGNAADIVGRSFLGTPQYLGTNDHCHRLAEPASLFFR